MPDSSPSEMMECCSHTARLAIGNVKFHSGFGSVTLGDGFLPLDLSLLICQMEGLIPLLIPVLGHWKK